VDGGHTLTELTATTLGMSKAVVLVVQQSVIQLRQAARTIRILFSEFGIQDDRVTVVVNRYSKRAEVSLEDIQRTLGREKLVVLPNSFKSVAASIDGGMPLLDFEPASPVTKAIVELQSDLCGTTRADKTGLLRRALPMFSGDKT
jgi:pilus assembly protein CpaE